MLDVSGTEFRRPSVARAGDRGSRRIGPIDVVVTDRRAALADVMEAIQTRSARIFGFCNAHTHDQASRSPKFASVLARMTLFNDGVAIDLASMLLYGESFPENLNGTDLIPQILDALPEQTRIYLVGSSSGVADRAGDVLAARHRNVRIVGSHHGFMSPSDSVAVVDEIDALKTDLVLVCMGQPVQELWAAEFLGKIDAVAICGGAFLDFTTGEVRRAPKLVRQMRVEWLYRLVQEPRRLSDRYLRGAVRFGGAVLRQRYLKR